MTYILVAEDDPHIQLLIQRKLEIAGYKVRTTNNGKTALDTVLTDIPRIVLLDIMLPDMNGLDVCNSIKIQLGAKAPPILIISAKGSQFDVNAAEQLGADGYLIKPFSLGDLLEHVQSLLRG